MEEEARGEPNEGLEAALAENAELLSTSRGEAGADAQAYSDEECVVRGSDGEVEPRVTRCQLVQEGVTLLLMGTNDGTVSRPAAILRDVAANLERG